MGQSERINLDPYLHLFPEDVGRVRVNHDNCPAGVDTRKRLELTRQSNDVLLAFCHHCKGWGVQRKRGVRSIHNRPRKETYKTSSGTYMLPKDLVLNFEEWPIEAQLWPRTYDIDPKHLYESRIGYSPSLRRVVIPCYDEHGTTIGFQTRKIFKDDEDPKYLTYATKGTRIFRPYASKGSKSIVFVEDALSALKVANVSIGPIAVLGSGLSTPALCAILDKTKKGLGIDSILIVLDNDNASVKKSQSTLLKKCNLLSPDTDNRIVQVTKDPKEYSVNELETLLCPLKK